MLWRLFKALIVLVVLAGIGLTIYAYLGPLIFPSDFAAPTETISQPVTLQVD